MTLEAFLELLQRFSRPFGRSPDLEKTFSACVDALRELVPCDSAGIATFESKGRVRLHASGGAGSALLGGEASEPLLRAASSRLPILGPPPCPSEAEPYASGLVLPLLSGHRPLGALSLASRREGAFDDQTAAMLEPLARLLAAELDRLELLRAEADSSILNRLGALLASAPDVRQVFPQAAALLEGHLTFGAMAILLLAEDGRHFTIFTASEPEPVGGDLALGSRLPVEGTASGLALESGESVLVRDTAQGLYPYDRRLAEAGWRTHLAHPLRHSSGTVGTLNLLAHEPDGLGEPREDLLGAIANTIAIAVDNTRLFRRVSRSESRYSSLVENADDVIYRLDTSGRLRFINRKGEDLLGRSRQELEGLTWHELVETAGGGAADIKPLLEGRSDGATMELELRGPGGARTLTSHKLRVIREADRMVAIQGMARDISKQKEAERTIQSFRDLVEALDDYIFMADRDTRLVAMNRKARHELGLATEDVSGMTIFDLHPASAQESIRSALDELLETGTATVELPIVTRSGREVPTRGRVTYQKETGTFQGVFRDISGQRSLNERQIQLEKLRALGEMSSGVAHTFSNLLAVIGTTVQVIRKAGRDADIETELDAIERTVQDGGAAVRRIQDFTRHGQEVLHTPLDLNAMASDVAAVAVNRQRAAAQEGAPAIDITLELSEVPSVIGSDSELREVLMNVLFNAMDAMRDKGTISIRSYRHQGRVVLAIQDTGPGMPAEVRGIFQPFFSTKDDRGSGLGLSIALNIMQQHRGTIEVDSEPGTGTTVRLLFPEHSVPATAPGPGKTAPARRRARVLLVEDETSLLTQLARLMEEDGHSVDAVPTGAEALERLGSGSYDMVFTDVGMIPVSGWEVAARARERNVRVVFITGWGGEVSEEVAQARGVDAVLRKPFQPDRVFTIISKLLEA